MPGGRTLHEDLPGVTSCLVSNKGVYLIDKDYSSTRILFGNAKHVAALRLLLYDADMHIKMHATTTMAAAAATTMTSASPS